MAEFVLNSRPVFRATAADQRHAATIARHIRAAGRTPTPTIVLRVALAKAAMELDPPMVPDAVVARMFGPRVG